MVEEGGGEREAIRIIVDWQYALRSHSLRIKSDWKYFGSQISSYDCLRWWNITQVDQMMTFGQPHS